MEFTTYVVSIDYNLIWLLLENSLCIMIEYYLILIFIGKLPIYLVFIEKIDFQNSIENSQICIILRLYF